MDLREAKIAVINAQIEETHVRREKLVNGARERAQACAERARQWQEKADKAFALADKHEEVANKKVAQLQEELNKL